MILETLEAKSISFIHSKITDDHLNISCILLSENGEKTVINYQSPNQHLFSEDHDYSFLDRTSSVYMANMPDVSFTEKLRLAKYIKQQGKLLFANFGVVDCRRSKEQIIQLIEQIDVLIVNGHEFADIVKTAYERISFNRDILGFYFREFKDKTFIVTEGAKGSYAYVQGKHFHQEAVKPAKILDSTGAGDGYSAGFISEYIQTGDVQKSMLAGSEYAAKILAKVGAN